MNLYTSMGPCANTILAFKFAPLWCCSSAGIWDTWDFRLRNLLACKRMQMIYRTGISFLVVCLFAMGPLLANAQATKGMEVIEAHTLRHSDARPFKLSDSGFTSK